MGSETIKPIITPRRKITKSIWLLKESKRIK